MCHVQTGEANPETEKNLFHEAAFFRKKENQMSGHTKKEQYI